MCRYASRDFPVLSVRRDLVVSLDSGAALQTAQHGMGVNRTIVGLMAAEPDGEQDLITLNHLCSSAVLPLANSLAKTPQLSAVQARYRKADNWSL